MANELTLTLSMSASKGFLVSRSAASLRRDISGDSYAAGVQAIGFAAHEAVVIAAEVATAGFCWFKNLDATNFVQIGVDVGAAFYPLVKLLPGDCAIVPLATTTLYAKADTAAVNLEFCLLER
jgi:hypothetical protein